MHFRYNLDDNPPLLESILIGLQWCAILIPWIIILGKIAGGFHGNTAHETTIYLQKLFFVAAIFVLIEVFAGHRLPLVFGPSTVVLIGIISSQGFGSATIYTSVLIGSVLLTVCAGTGFFGTLRKLFTLRVVSVVLLLVAFCLMPTVVRLVTDTTMAVPATKNLLFALLLVLSMVTLHHFLRGIGRSTLIISTMFAATIIHFIIFPGTFDNSTLKNAAPVATFFTNMTTSFSFDAGLTMSFIVCYIALAINDLGSIQSMNTITDPPDTTRRIDRGVLVTGMGNIAAGFLGVIGQVNYSMSMGIVLSSGCASRWALIPAAVILLVIGFSPSAITLLGTVPPVVIGGALTYILGTQVAGGLTILLGASEKPDFDDLLVVGMPLLLAIVIAFLPGPVVQSFPALIRPVAGNSFVMGVIAVLLMEHVIFRR